jgi:hypothetical protein
MASPSSSSALRQGKSSRLSMPGLFPATTLPSVVTSLSTMAPADFCSITETVTGNRAFLYETHVEQISPDKNVNCRYTTAAFTLPPEPVGLCHVVLTCPVTRPYMLFLSVGS